MKGKLTAGQQRRLDSTMARIPATRAGERLVSVFIASGENWDVRMCPERAAALRSLMDDDKLSPSRAHDAATAFYAGWRTADAGPAKARGAREPVHYTRADLERFEGVTADVLQGVRRQVEASETAQAA